MSVATLAELFLEVAQRQQPQCLLHKAAGRYVAVSNLELAQRVRQLAGAMERLGVERGDRVALMAESGPHWPTVDFATLGIGGVLVPVYPTLLPEQAAYIVRDSGAKLLFVQGGERLQGLLSCRDRMPELERLIAIDAETVHLDVSSLQQLYELGSDADAADFEAKCRACRPEDLATLIYTSGTTGEPKGVMLTHGNIVSNIVAGMETLKLQGDETALSFLPLSHSFERTVDYGYFLQGITIAYAESIQTLAQNMLEVRPHVFVSVPRVYEKLLARIRESVAGSPPLKQRLFRWATTTGLQGLPYRLHQQRPPVWLRLRLMLAEQLVFSKIRQRLGGRFRVAFSGAAPLALDVAEFFWAAGIPILEGYGLTETSPVVSANTWAAVKLGSVGRPIPGVEVRIAADGEVLVRGPNVMQGYFNLPEATEEVMDDNGWFYTGDIGSLDEEGFLSITDRKKELIVNAYGKNVAPAPIENALKSSPFIEQAVVIGDRRSHLVALLVPDFEALGNWCERQGLGSPLREQLLQEAKVRELFRDQVEEVNRRLARYEQIHAWELLAEELTMESGALTPTQKVKRRVVNEQFAAVIESLYQ